MKLKFSFLQNEPTRSNYINNRIILAVFLCCFDDTGTVGFATVTFTLAAGTFSFLPSSSSWNNFLTSLFCNRKKFLLVTLNKLFWLHFSVPIHEIKQTANLSILNNINLIFKNSITILLQKSITLICDIVRKMVDQKCGCTKPWSWEMFPFCALAIQFFHPRWISTLWHLQKRQNVHQCVYGARRSIILMMEAAITSQTVYFYQTARCSIPEGRHFQFLTKFNTCKLVI